MEDDKEMLEDLTPPHSTMQYVAEELQKKNGFCNRRHAITARNETSTLIPSGGEFTDSHTIYFSHHKYYAKQSTLEHLIENLRGLPGEGLKSALQRTWLIIFTAQP